MGEERENGRRRERERERGRAATHETAARGIQRERAQAIYVNDSSRRCWRRVRLYFRHFANTLRGIQMTYSHKPLTPPSFTHPRRSASAAFLSPDDDTRRANATDVSSYGASRRDILRFPPWFSLSLSQLCTLVHLSHRRLREVERRLYRASKATSPQMIALRFVELFLSVAYRCS